MSDESTAVAEPKTDSASPGAPVKSAKAWKANAVHTVTLPSGTVVKIKLPNLAGFVKAGTLPSSLLEASQKVAKASREGEEVPKELYEEMETFNNFLVIHTVVSPEITPEDLTKAPDDPEAIPAEDIEMIVGFATRRLDFDAVGHHLAGLETVDSFRKFRGLDSSAEDILNLARG